MSKFTDQMQQWSSRFGKEYTDRNPLTVEAMNDLYKKRFGLSRTELNIDFLEDFDRSAKILEVGANVGTQLLCLQSIGFLNLYGIELQSYAVEFSKKNTKGINLIQGTAFDIPFKDAFFDIVFTSGVLIHISPSDIDLALQEIYRCTKNYIWGFEYYADKYEEITYRGKANLLWKTNFSKLYMEKFGDLKPVMEKKYKYSDSENFDSMFLLSK